MAAGGRELNETLRKLLDPAVAEAGYDLEEVAVSRAGARSVVRVVVDRDGGVDLDAVADASRVIGEVLDAHDDALPGAYALEVTSPGVDRPLTAPRHWRRNLGRLVAVRRVDGTEVTGRITESTEDMVTLEGPGGLLTVPLGEVARAVVQIEFTRAAPSAPTEGDDDTDNDDTDDIDTDGDDTDEDMTHNDTEVSA